MIFTENTHLKFADYFGESNLTPYIYLLSKKLSEGSICIELDTVEKKDFAELPDFVVDKFTEKLPQSKFVGKPGDNLPFIKDDNRLYLQRYYIYETQIVNRIKHFIQISHDKTNERIQLLNNHKTVLKQLFPDKSSQIDWQFIATLSALLNNFTIITGGPGTGKTTTVAKILSLLLTLNPNTKIALAAPTGKAAARMAESLGNTKIVIDEKIKTHLQALTPLTIHRLLGAKKGNIYFKHNEDNPIQADVIVIDECSMIDAALFAKLLTAINDNTRVILLGDKDQLSSVEAGSLFGDICVSVNELNQFSNDRRKILEEINQQDFNTEYKTQSAKNALSDAIVQLKVSYRFNANEGIGQLSNAILNQNINTIEKLFSSKNDIVHIDTEYNRNVLYQFLNGYGDFIQEEDTVEALKLLDNQRILCAVKDGEYGMRQFNLLAENYLSQKFKSFKKDSIFYHNRPILVTQNNYTLGLFNGDIGIIRKDENGKPMAWFKDEESPTKLKSVQPGLISNMETVFAMTIHKSQGSEFENVMVVLPANEENPILTKELLYTGVTRAKSTVTVQSSKAALIKACSQGIQRSSGIKDRLYKI